MTEKKSQLNGFKKTSPMLVFLLTTLSGGIYLPIWFLSRRQAFNNLVSEEKLSKNLFIYITAGFVLVILISFYTGYLQAIAFLSGSEPGALATWMDLAANLLVLVLLIPLIGQLFKAKRILADHINGHLGKNETFSTLWTILFLNAYLQHKINTSVVEG
jgi:fumarate reductase subunit C